VKMVGGGEKWKKEIKLLTGKDSLCSRSMVGGNSSPFETSDRLERKRQNAERGCGLSLSVNSCTHAGITKTCRLFGLTNSVL
jgi:hypothetical protein